MHPTETCPWQEPGEGPEPPPSLQRATAVTHLPPGDTHMPCPKATIWSRRCWPVQFPSLEQTLPKAGHAGRNLGGGNCPLLCLEAVLHHFSHCLTGVFAAGTRSTERWWGLVAPAQPHTGALSLVSPKRAARSQRRRGGRGDRRTGRWHICAETEAGRLRNATWRRFLPTPGRSEGRSYSSPLRNRWHWPCPPATGALSTPRRFVHPSPRAEQTQQPLTCSPRRTLAPTSQPRGVSGPRALGAAEPGLRFRNS